MSCSSEVTLFRCISLLEYHGILPCPISSLKPTSAISSHKCHRNVSLPYGASLWNGMFSRVEGQYTTLPLRAKVELGAMAMKEYSAFSKAPSDSKGSRNSVVNFFAEGKNACLCPFLYGVLFCYFCLHNRRSMSSNFLVIHISKDSSSRPAAFLLLIFVSITLISSSINCLSLMSRCLLIIFKNSFISGIWGVSEQILEMFFPLLKSFLLAGNF